MFRVCGPWSFSSVSSFSASAYSVLCCRVFRPLCLWCFCLLPFLSVPVRFAFRCWVRRLLCLFCFFSSAYWALAVLGGLLVFASTLRACLTRLLLLEMPWAPLRGLRCRRVPPVLPSLHGTSSCSSYFLPDGGADDCCVGLTHTPLPHGNFGSDTQRKWFDPLSIDTRV